MPGATHSDILSSPNYISVTPSIYIQNLESILDGEAFYDFGYGNETGYYDVTKMDNGVPCRGDAGSKEFSWQEVEDKTDGDPAGVCYTGVYAPDAFMRRARKVRGVVVVVVDVVC